MTQYNIIPVKHGFIKSTHINIGGQDHVQKIFYANNYANRLGYNAANEVRGEICHTYLDTLKNIPLQRDEYNNRILHRPRINFGLKLTYYKNAWGVDLNNTRPNQFYDVEPGQTVKLAVQNLYGNLIRTVSYSTNTYLSVSYWIGYHEPTLSTNGWLLDEVMAQRPMRDAIDFWTSKRPEGQSSECGMTPIVIAVDDSPVQNKPDTQSDVEGVTIKDSDVPQHVKDHMRVQLQYGLGAISSDEIDYAVRLVQAAKLHWNVKEDLTVYDTNKGTQVDIALVGGDQKLPSNSAKSNPAFYNVKHHVGSGLSNTPAWAMHLVKAKIIQGDEFLKLDRLDCLTHYEASKQRTYARLDSNGKMVWALIPMSPFEKNDLSREISAAIAAETARQAARQNQSWKKLGKRRKR